MAVMLHNVTYCLYSRFIFRGQVLREKVSYRKLLLLVKQRNTLQFCKKEGGGGGEKNPCVYISYWFFTANCLAPKFGSIASLRSALETTGQNTRLRRNWNQMPWNKLRSAAILSIHHLTISGSAGEFWCISCQHHNLVLCLQGIYSFWFCQR